ncbi:MAG: cysteine desulfurase family protein [Phycisphaerales bacterium]
MIYLDNNATTRPADEAVEAAIVMMREQWQNPSSVHRPGQAARQRIELARQPVARLIGARPRDLTFTSGATESIHLAILGLLEVAGPRRGIVTTALEHEAVRGACDIARRRHDADVREVAVDAGGVIDADALGEMLTDDVAVVSVHAINNETGVVQDIARIGGLCRERGVVCHVDATQWIGKLPLDVSETPVDLMSFSAHKFHGVKGCGALYARRGMRLSPRTSGSQERERRGGTENVPGIVAMGVAADHASAWLADESNRAAQAALRDRFESRVLAGAAGAVVNGDASHRVWNTTNIGFPRLEAEALLLLLSEKGVCASAGAACSSGSLDPSPVLLAMGVPDAIAHGSVRFSLSRETTESEVDEAAEIVIEAVARLGRGMPGA